MKTSPATRDFLLTLIAELELADCHPILLRNYEAFPDEIGNDLDIFISYDSLKTAFEALKECAARKEGHIAHLHRRGYFVAVWLRFPDCPDPVHVDLYHGALTWHGLPFLNEVELVKSALAVEGIHPYKIPLPAHESLISCLASVLWGGFFKKRYLDQLGRLLSTDAQFDLFQSNMVGKFGKLGEALVNNISERKAATAVDQSYARKLRMRLMLGSLLSQPLRSICAWLKHWMEEAACYLFRLPGVAVQYDAELWTGTELKRVENILENYFGATHAMPWRKGSPLQQLEIRRLRGKNHLILIRGNCFKINGDQVRPDDAKQSLTAENLAQKVLAELLNRNDRQYIPT